MNKRHWTRTHIYQCFDSLLDILWVRLEPSCQLPGDFIDKIIVGHLLSVLHYSDDAGLGPGCSQIIYRSSSPRTSVWYCRSSSILSRVSFRSSVLSTLADTVPILILCIGQVKLLLKENESCGFTSRPGGCFFRILYLAQASDCRWRCSSCSGIDVVDLISCGREDLERKSHHDHGYPRTSYVKKPSSSTCSKRRRMIKANVDTFKSCFRALNCTRTSAFPRDGCHVNLRPEWRER